MAHVESNKISDEEKVSYGKEKKKKPCYALFWPCERTGITQVFTVIFKVKS